MASVITDSIFRNLAEIAELDFASYIQQPSAPVKLNESNYKPYVDTTYKYYLSNKNGDDKLDKMLDKIESYDNYQGVEYYRIDDHDFEFYRIKRKII